MAKTSNIKFICNNFLEKIAENEEENTVPGLASVAGSIAALSQAGKPFLVNIKNNTSNVNLNKNLSKIIKRIPNTNLFSKARSAFYDSREPSLGEQLNAKLRIPQVKEDTRQMLATSGYIHDNKAGNIYAEDFNKNKDWYHNVIHHNPQKEHTAFISITNPLKPQQGFGGPSVSLSYTKNKMKGDINVGIQHGSEYTTGTMAHELGHFKEFTKKGIRGDLQKNKFSKYMNKAKTIALGTGVALAGTNSLKSITGMSENTKDTLDLGLAGAGAVAGLIPMSNEITASYSGTKMLPKRPLKTHLKNVKDTWSGVPTYSKYMATPLLAYGAKKAIEGIAGDK